MRRPGTVWTVDWAGRPAAGPEVGHLVRHISARGIVTGFFRVTSVRQVNVRKPLPEGYSARYRVGASRVGDRRPEGEAWDWTLTAFPRKPKPPIDKDPFSPLL